MDKKIGVIGGMGPMASQLFYKYVTEMTDAACDQEHVRMIIYSDSGMPDRTRAILKGEYDEVYSRMLDDARTLQNCGCEAIAITCNTAHFFGDMIADKLSIPIIHMIKETTAKIAEEEPGAKVAVLAMLIPLLTIQTLLRNLAKVFKVRLIFSLLPRMPRLVVLPLKHKPGRLLMLKS